MIRVRRVYDPGEQGEGARFLVDGLWPRGLSKESLDYQAWLKEVAPSAELRRWFAHDPERWEEFQRRYAAELDEKRESWRPLMEAARRGDVTLLYAARDRAHNNALALKRYLEQQWSDDSLVQKAAERRRSST
jgi:uncharacterized protein YeaO (DUF488 family)